MFGNADLDTQLPAPIKVKKSLDISALNMQITVYFTVQKDL